LGSFCTFDARPRPIALSNPGRRELGSFCTIHGGTPTGCPKLASFCTLRLFVAWASPPDTFRRWPRLGSFCAFTFRPGQIGFVLRIWPPAPARGGPKLGSFCTVSSASYPQPGKLGSFCTFHSPAETRPTREPPLPTYPSHPKFGFVLRIFRRAPPPDGAKLGSFCVFGLRRPRTATSFNPQSRNWVRFARIVTNGTKRTAVNGTETLLSWKFSCLVLTLPAGRTTSCESAVPSARRQRRFYI
jgi:hypothetical protein